MVKMNRKVEYALIALKYFAQKPAGQLTSVKEICEATDVPFDATARVMQLMAQGGLLKSEHGAHGGYLLVKDLSRVSLHDLLAMVCGPVELVKCLGSEEACELVGHCQIQNPIGVLNAKLVQFFSSLSLQEILLTRNRQSSSSIHQNLQEVSS